MGEDNGAGLGAGMQRRYSSVVGGAAARPVAARAQQPARPLMGYFGSMAEAGGEPPTRIRSGPWRGGLCQRPQRDHRISGALRGQLIREYQT